MAVEDTPLASEKSEVSDRTLPAAEKYEPSLSQALISLRASSVTELASDTACDHTDAHCGSSASGPVLTRAVRSPLLCGAQSWPS
jgi:hypothetical protein